MHHLLQQESNLYQENLENINIACNAYISNQIPDNAVAVERLVRQFVDNYLISSNDDIKTIVNKFNEIINLDRISATNAEADFIAEIRTIVDIKTVDNLVIKMQH